MVELVERNQWGAASPRSRRRMETPTPHVKLWHIWTIDPCYDLGQCAGALSEMQTRDFNRGLADIKYNFIIGNDGRVYEGRGWQWEGSHNLPADFVGFRIDIGFIGRFSSLKDVPDNMKHAKDELIKMGVDLKYISPRYDVEDDLQDVVGKERVPNISI